MPESTPFSLDGEHRIVTPEYVEFSFVLAGRLARFLALCIDTAITFALTVLVGLAVLALSLLELAITKDVGLGTSLFFIAQFIIDWGYMLAFEVLWNGQTPGKRALGLRVMQDTGVRVGPYQSVLRNLLRPLDKLPLFYFVGGFCTLLSRSQQRLGDVLAGTIVVQQQRLTIPAATASDAEVSSLSYDGEFSARVSKISRDEEDVIFAAVFRREELGLKARLALFAAISEHLQSDLNFVKPPHMSDEKLVLAIANGLVARKRQSVARPSRSQRTSP
jgi:uncharacterized RDD family membrane protein YckC